MALGGLRVLRLLEESADSALYAGSIFVDDDDGDDDDGDDDAGDDDDDEDDDGDDDDDINAVTEARGQFI